MRYERSRAIRLKCYDCSGFNRAEIRECPVKDCALYPYRMGKEDPKAFTEPKGYKQFMNQGASKRVSKKSKADSEE